MWPVVGPDELPVKVVVLALSVLTQARVRVLIKGTASCREEGGQCVTAGTGKETQHPDLTVKLYIAVCYQERSGGEKGMNHSAY